MNVWRMKGFLVMVMFVACLGATEFVIGTTKDFAETVKHDQPNLFRCRVPSMLRSVEYCRFPVAVDLAPTKIGSRLSKCVAGNCMHTSVAVLTRVRYVDDRQKIS